MNLAALSLFLMAVLTACGDDGEGNEDTLLTGFSGFVILCLVVFFVYRWAKKRRA